MNPLVLGIPCPNPNNVAPPFCVTVHTAGATNKVEEKLTVQMVPVVAVPPTIVISPRWFVLVLRLAGELATRRTR